MIAEISLATVATVILMLTIGIPLIWWLEERHRRKLDEEYLKDKEWRKVEPIDWSKYGKNRKD